MVLAKPENTNVRNQFDLTGKVAAVTGGTRGIGVEAARGLAEAGASVAIIYTSSKDAESIASQMSQETGVKVVAYQSDVRDPASIAATINKIAADFGRIDIMVANAGITKHVAAIDQTPESFSEVMKVNLDGAFYTAQAAAKIFQKQGSGNVIFTASVSALLVNVPQKQAAYNASKAGLVQMAKCLAVEWVDFARVNCVSPGFIATDMIAELPEDWKKLWHTMVPAQRFCDPYELKGVYVFLASDASSYITGANLVVDGAYTLP
ncbi:oxidoreductase [Morchella snyderi]|nr:oxidoreductase [Morchella snyderi]